MQTLRLVGFNEGRDGLVLRLDGTSDTFDFELPIDARLFAAIGELNGSPTRAGRSDDEAGAGVAQPQPASVVRPSAPPRHGPTSALTPREMQERLRGGRSVQEVAREAGVEPDWVARFVAPVLAEQAAVVEAGRAATYHKPRVGTSAAPLGAAVRRNLAGRGVFLDAESEAEAWSAHQVDGPVWVLVFRYRSRGRDQEARWTFDLETGELASASKLGGLLGHVASAARSTTAVSRATARSRMVPKPVPTPERRALPLPKAAAAEAARRKSATSSPAAPVAAATRKRATATTARPQAKKAAPVRVAAATTKKKAAARTAAATTKRGPLPAPAPVQAPPATKRAARRVIGDAPPATNGTQPRRAR